MFLLGSTTNAAPLSPIALKERSEAQISAGPADGSNDKQHSISAIVRKWQKLTFE
ncbi:MAG TPA: hypothetical protein VEK31_02640 [Xanthobacteraceae bacterium]|nr:hypothetical protein [Xanthobacteraceae bacterium]